MLRDFDFLWMLHEAPDDIILQSGTARKTGELRGDFSQTKITKACLWVVLLEAAPRSITAKLHQDTTARVLDHATDGKVNLGVMNP